MDFRCVVEKTGERKKLKKIERFYGKGRIYM